MMMARLAPRSREELEGLVAEVVLGEVSWDRMVRAVEKVRDRLNRAVAALDKGQVEYVVIGGNAVAAWVSRIDESAVRNTQDVDILIRRSDLEAAPVITTSRQLACGI
jgi:hypothetical protein